jgi:hypothetical protein
MEKKHVSLKFNAKIKPLEKINEEFALCKCYVQGIGKNRNFSYMSKENVLRNLSTLNYVPVVGHLIEKEDGTKYMGGHDYIITDDWEFKALTVPYGVVKNDSFDFEMVDEYGTQVEYLTAEIILWLGRYPELKEAIYSEDFYFNQSMELNLDNGNYRPYAEDSNYTELLDWNYSALCLLGRADDKSSEEHCEPCFIESKVVPIQYNFAQEEFTKVMGELKNELAFYFDKENYEKGGQILEDIKVEDEVIEVEEIQEEIIDEPTEEIAETVESEEVVVADEADDTPDEVVEEVVAEETEEEITEESQEDEFSLLQKEFEDYKLNYSTPNSEVEELKSFKENVLMAQRKQAEEDLFSKFEKQLSTMEEFTNIKENAKDFTIENLEEKLFALLGKKNASFSFKAKDNSVVKVPFETKETDDSENLYGGLFARYSKN